jgi:uncharacterized membrane protein YhaH (DUF805 family)
MPSNRGAVDFAKFVPAVKRCFAKYGTSAGRASLAEYWWWTVFTCVTSWILAAVGGTNGALYWVFCLAVLCPGILAAIRRLHDVRKSGWLYLWAFTGVGAVYVLYLLAQPSDRGTNQYGAPNYL